MFEGDQRLGEGLLDVVPELFIAPAPGGKEQHLVCPG